MKLKAIIFDVDGTIVDSERWGHLPACNEAFEVMGLDLRWNWETFLPLLEKIPGNANRLRHVLQTTLEYNDKDIEDIIEKFVVLKKDIYIKKYAANVRLRDGIISFIQQIIDKGLRLAIVTTSYERQVHALLDTQLTTYKKYFNPILGKETGIKTGAQGMLYEQCLEMMQLTPEECLVIEDSGAGAKAAMKANIPTVITYNEYTKKENFEGALIVTDSMKHIDTDKLLTR